MHEDIARRLREFGYPQTTAEDIKTELSLPKEKQSIIGMFATGWLEEYE
jgi:hypothetical protein